MLDVLQVIAPLFLLIFGSAIFQKVKNLNEHWIRVLNEYALKIGFPILIFSSLSKAPFSFFEQAPLILVNSIFILLSFVFVFVFGKLLGIGKQRFLTLFICLILGNAAYLGIPVLSQVFGEDILSIASLIVAIYLFWIFSVGIAYLDYSSKKANKNVVRNILKNLFGNPLFLAVILGFIFSSSQFELPSIVLKSLDMVTASVTPTVLIVIGLFLGKSHIGKIKEWYPVLIFSVFRLMLFPLAFYLGLLAFGIETRVFSSSILQAAMPLAITPFALADQYQLDKEFIARSIVLSTILSVISLPLWISFLNG